MKAGEFPSHDNHEEDCAGNWQEHPQLRTRNASKSFHLSPGVNERIISKVITDADFSPKVGLGLLIRLFERYYASALRRPVAVDRRIFTISTLKLAVGLRLGALGRRRRLRVLIVDGINNHTWQIATAAIREILDNTGIFDVDVSTTPPAGSPESAWEAWRPDFKPYSAVIVNFNSGDNAKAVMWPQPIRDAFVAYVREGGGMLSYHAANNAFLLWPEYNQMIGMGWRPKSFGPSVHIGDHDEVIEVPAGQGFDPNHPPRFDFPIHVRDPHHPMTSGMPRVWMHPSEQLTHGQHGPVDGFDFLTYARSPITQQNEPMDWVHTYGRGRVYVTMLGHTWVQEPSPDLECVGFQTLLSRGVEWIASGRVTIPIPTNFPTENQISLRHFRCLDSQS